MLSAVLTSTKLPGRTYSFVVSPPRLAPHEEAGLTHIVPAGPDPEVDGLSAFTREDLVRICEVRFGKSFNPSSMGATC